MDRVIPAAGDQQVGAFVAGDRVGERVADPEDIARAGIEGEVLDVVVEVEPRAGVDRIGPFAGVLEHQVGLRIDVVGVVAGAAVELVHPGAAVERVVAGEADQGVGTQPSRQDIETGSARYGQGIRRGFAERIVGVETGLGRV